MRDILACVATVTDLGRMGENLATRVIFDVEEWLAEWPGAALSVIMNRPADTESYPVSGANLELDGNRLYWTITSAETAQRGRAMFELVAVESETVVKSQIFSGMILDALDGSGDAPEPWEAWQEEFIRLERQAQQAAQDAEDARDAVLGVSLTVEVEDITGGHRVTITDTQGTRSFDVLNGGPGDPGAPGADGVSPTVTVAEITGGHRVTIIDAEGTRSFDVMDGKDGLVQDVRVAGTSVISGQGVADIPMASATAPGVVISGAVSVSGATPTINAQPGVRYVCGEVATLELVLPAGGLCDVVFTSGATPTVLTIVPPTGVTVRWPSGFDPEGLTANTTYEINILDGLGVVGQWS